MEENKPIPPFRRFVIQNFPFIEEDFDALTNYGLLSKIVEYLNKVIDSQNEVSEEVETLASEFTDLKNYIDNYFDDLDVQDEINNKLDQMVQDGTLKSIINNDIFAEINNKVLQNTVDISANTSAIEGKISEGEASAITMSMLSQEVREALTGGSTAVVAEDSVDTVNIVNNAVTFFKLDNYLQDSKVLNYKAPMALGSKSNGIATENGDTHKVYVSGPTSTSFGWYKVALTKGKIYAVSSYNNYSAAGLLIADGEDNVLYNSLSGTSSPITVMSHVFRANDTGLYAYLNVTNSIAGGSSMLQYSAPMIRELNILENKVTVQKNLEPIKVLTGRYPSITEAYDAPHTPIYANIDTEIYQMCKGLKYHVTSNDWSQSVGLYILDLDESVIYKSSEESVGDNYVPVDYTFTATTDGYIVVPKYSSLSATVEVIYPFDNTTDSSETLTFSKWFALGDSLTEANFRASDNYVSYITEELDITSVNLGHSGSGYMKVNNDDKTIRTEVNEISSYNYNTDIITVMGSINDWEYIENSLGQLGDTGTDTIYGCMYNFFSSLQTRFMGTRLGVITPPVIGTSYSAQRDNFAKYNKALKETAELFGVPVLDLTYSCNLKPWETNFRNEFYSADGTGGTGQVDSVHPNSKGHWLIHNKIKEFLKTL